jgi:hypothetical protein
MHSLQSTLRLPLGRRRTVGLDDFFLVVARIELVKPVAAGAAAVSVHGEEKVENPVPEPRGVGKTDVGRVALRAADQNSARFAHRGYYGVYYDRQYPASGVYLILKAWTAC